MEFTLHAYLQLQNLPGASKASQRVSFAGSGSACRRDHGDFCGLAGLCPVGNLLLPPGSGQDPHLQGLSPLEEAGGRPVAVETCRPDALHGMRGWPGRSGPRSGWPDLEDHASNPVFRARLFRVHPGRVSYLLHCDVQASVSPPPEWVLPKPCRERAY